MGAELWVTTILKILFLAGGGYLALWQIIPLLEDFLKGFIKEEKSLDGLMSILVIFVSVFIVSALLKLLMETGSKLLGYLNVVSPALDFLISLINPLKWVILAGIVVIGLKNLKI